MSAYRRGYCAEKKVRRLFEQRGYWCIEARGSHGLWDIVATRRDGIVFIQVKRNCKPSSAEYLAMKAFTQHPPHALKQVWMLRSRREPIVENL